MSIQTVFKAGNSHVVAMPKEFGIKTGEKVEIRKSSDGESVVITKVEKSKVKAKKSQAEFKKWLKETIEEDREILDELAIR